MSRDTKKATHTTRCVVGGVKRLLEVGYHKDVHRSTDIMMSMHIDMFNEIW